MVGGSLERLVAGPAFLKVSTRMKVSNKQLRRIIREERDLLLSEQDNTLNRYLDGSYDDYRHGDPTAVAADILAAIDELADVVSRMLPEAGDALSPGMRATILPTIMSVLADRGVRLK